MEPRALQDHENRNQESWETDFQSDAGEASHTPIQIITREIHHALEDPELITNVFVGMKLCRKAKVPPSIAIGEAFEAASPGWPASAPAFLFGHTTGTSRSNSK
ncbi:hypothetical protein RUND412_009761 [Rhizina undulata]